MKKSSLTLQVIIREINGVLWEGQAECFSSVNEVGVFDVLPKHARFVGLIKEFITIHSGGQEKKWKIETGVMSVTHDKIEVFLGC